MKATTLEKAILATLEYYNCIDWPLSIFELYARLIPPLSERKNFKKKKFSLGEIVHTLDTSVFLNGYISQRHGFYFLRGKEHLYSRRIEATKEAQEKLKRVFAYRWVFIGTPFVKGVMVSGSVAGGWPSSLSDIDILVITKAGRIWTARFFLTLATTLLGIRRHGKRIANRFCLNHYITDERLAIPFESLYNTHTYINLIPVVNRENIYERFFTANLWIGGFFWNDIPSPQEHVYISYFPVKKMREFFMKNQRRVMEFLLGGFLGNMLEAWVKKLQQHFIEKNPLSRKGGGRISAQDVQLEFHPQSKEQVILRRYNKKIKALGLEEFYPEGDSGLFL